MHIYARRSFPKCLFDGAQGGGGGAPVAPAAPAAPANPIADALGGVPAAAPTAPAADAPFYAGFADPALKEHMTARGYDSVEKLANAAFQSHRALSGAKDVIAVPGEGATPQQQSEFFTKLGKPASADAYDFKFPEGFQADDGFVKAAKGFFHGANLTGAQAQAVVQGWQGYITERQQAETAATKQAIDGNLAKVQTELGAGFESAKQKGGAFLNSLGLSAETVGWFAQNGGAAAVTELLARTGAKLSGEGGLITGAGGGASDPGSMSAEQATAAINEMNKDPEVNKALFDKNHEKHAEVTGKMTKLYEAVAKGRRA